MATQSKAFSFGKKLGAGAKSKEAGATSYTGPKPPAEAYVVDIKRVWIHTSNEAPAVRFLAEINDPRPEKKKYSGYPIWGYQGITDKTIGYLNQFLIALDDGGNAALDGFHEGVTKTKVDEKGVAHVLKFGDFLVKSPDCKIQMVVATKDGKPYKGSVKLEPTGYAGITGSELGNDEDEDGDDDAYIEEEEAAEEAEDEAEEDEDEELFDDEDDEDDEDED